MHTALYGYIKFMLGDAFLCSKVYKKMISPPETSVSNLCHLSLVPSKLAM